MKMVWGLALLALGYVVIAFSVKDMGMESKISMFFLIGMYFLHTCGELAISPVGLSVVNKLSPRRFASMMMAVFFLSSVVGNFTAGLFSGIIPQPEVKEILYVENSGYSEADIQLYTANLITKSDNPLEGCLTKSYRKINTKFEDNKLADNKKRYSKKDATNLNAMLLFEGQDSLNMSFTNAANTAKDVRSEKTVAAYAKNKDVMVRDVVINGQHVASYVFQNSQKQIFGMKINTLYSFFIIFIVMAGATSILLLLLHKRLEKLMHGIR
jgi:POT family proton-dependent oligopeptide transporter